MAVEKETQLEAWLEENMPDPGGGNPNYVETVTGTVDDPWGSLDYAQLVSDVANSNITVILSVPTLATRAYVVSNEYELSVSGAKFTVIDETLTLVLAVSVNYMDDGSLDKVFVWLNGTATDATSTLSSEETTLTIIHHPLPEN